MSAQRQAAEIDLLGIPLELGAGRAGCLMGPAALRVAGLAGMLRELGYVVRDHGDVAPVERPSISLPGSDACNSLDEIAGWTRAIHDRAYGLARAGGVPVFLGGDHSLSMGTISGIARHCREQGRDLVVIWLDAHADFNSPETTVSGNIHGMPIAFLSGVSDLRPLLGDRPLVPLAPEQIHLFGLRSIDGAERRALAKSGINSIDMRKIDQYGVAVLIERILASIKNPNTHLHVSLDVDFLDPALAPGVGTTVPGGATYREAHLIMEMLHESGLVGSLDVVELNPFLDERGKTACLAAELSASLFGRTTLETAPAPRRATGDLETPS